MDRRGTALADACSADVCGEHVAQSALWLDGHHIQSPSEKCPRQLAGPRREVEDRSAGGETLDQVAHRIPRMDAKYLGEIERGWHSPTMPTAKRIANALETKLSELFKGL